MSHENKKGMNLPNKLTVLRICLVPLFITVMMLPASVLHPLISGLIGVAFFIAASVTDLLDGKIARRYGLVTPISPLIRGCRTEEGSIITVMKMGTRHTRRTVSRLGRFMPFFFSIDMGDHLVLQNRGR